MHQPAATEDRFLTYTVNPKQHHLEIYWKDAANNRFGNFEKLKQWTAQQNQQLLFAMNGGMYMEDRSPLGLYIAHGKTIKPLNARHGEGNFYLQPNGVFYVTDDTAANICSTAGFNNKKHVAFATQSGPMLLINGVINSAFKEGSSNTNIRNAVGILPGNKILFAMSRVPVNFYDMALYFKQQGCSNALYLDGFVSRTYLPEKNWIQADGDFGVIIGVTDAKK
ncbi:MAG: phosphodiester glycosidase family protein [Bacteroidetes bacterium]|nr:phosphodiester glycosidase family protein [Bacteroidota bacterium]